MSEPTISDKVSHCSILYPHILVVLAGETLATDASQAFAQLAGPKQSGTEEKREKSGENGRESKAQAQLATWLWAWA